MTKRCQSFTIKAFDKVEHFPNCGERRSKKKARMPSAKKGPRAFKKIRTSEFTGK
jgi:hypothetical protein